MVPWKANLDPTVGRPLPEDLDQGAGGKVPASKSDGVADQARGQDLSGQGPLHGRIVSWFALLEAKKLPSTKTVPLTSKRRWQDKARSARSVASCRLPSFAAWSRPHAHDLVWRL